jgi:endoglucanase
MMSARRTGYSRNKKRPFFRIAPIGIACALCISWGSAQQSFVEQHGQLSVSGTRIVDKNGNPVTLRGMSLYWSQWQPAFYNASCIQWLRDDWKCTIVRPAMAVQSGGYLTNPAAEVAKVKTVVQACIELGIYCLIDYHETANGMDNLSKAQAFFKEMAQTYGSYPNIIYELWNEPLNTHSWATVIKPYHEAMIPVIRAIDAKNIIVCATRSWDQEVDEASLNPLDTSRFKNIAYTIHFYAATHKQMYRDKAQTALKNGIALFATEYGTTQATGVETMDTAETRLWYAFLDQNGIGSCNWSVSAIQEACAILPPNPPAGYANGGWAESTLKPSGKFVRTYLRTANTSPARLYNPGNQESSQGTFTIDRSGSKGRLLSIYDLSGACVKRQPLDESPFFWNTVRGGCLKPANGYYVMKMQEGNRSRTVRCAKIR